jgi:mannose-6-phosphate isomerase-like protein (cupin superfamily)
MNSAANEENRVSQTQGEAADVTVKRLDELEYFHHGAFGRLRAGLGVGAFGMQVVKLTPHSDLYPEHDHTDNDQEEVYVTLAGKATLTVGTQQYPLEPGVFIRVGARETRKVRTDTEPVELVVIGGVPGQAYTPPPYTESGAALAVASATPRSVAVGEAVTFEGSESTPGSGAERLTHAWDFEGTGSFVETGEIATYAYTMPGTYTATLRVTDSAGRSDKDKVQIDVRP